MKIETKIKETCHPEFTNVIERINLSISKMLKLVQHDMRVSSPFTVHSSQFTKFAFTLAETLIVIGVIGIVAALTLPNLNSSTGDKEKVAKVKKIYSSLTDAFDRAQAVYGPFDEWFKDIGVNQDAIRSERAAIRIIEFMKVSKVCGFNDGCFSHSKLIEADGSVNSDISDYYTDHAKYLYSVTLADGVSIGISSRFYDGTRYALAITVDIDGPRRGKNQEGFDIFRFTNEIMKCPPDIDGDLIQCTWSDFDTLVPDASFTNYQGAIQNYPTAWVIENGNLDYLKCLDELDWDTQTSCK